ncbi:discoidin domain-containing protein [Streptomyces sp. NRRL F-5727]|uniref:discoidin domain-containing protein n=1 Tax=Streptomyces sp. NRRL F-5727 TaxID=1463871 RepID=UPI00055F1311|nr:discoidin domain-containing protein [Streptomyces sp. NRRL F-5727]
MAERENPAAGNDAGHAGGVGGPGRRQLLRTIAAIGAGAAGSGLLGLGGTAAAATPEAGRSASTEVRPGAVLRATIDATHPAHLINLGQSDEPYQGTLAQLWSTVPDGLKPYCYVNLIPGSEIHDVPAATDWIQARLDAAEAAGIPVTVQVAQGATGTRAIPAHKWRTWAQTHPRTFVGLNAAELYNGIDQSDYLIDLFHLVGEQGMFFFWTDTNIYGTHGMMLDYMQNNARFLPAMKANAKNLVLMNKESFATDSTDALIKGLWLTGYIGNWGSSTDWWKWGLDGKGVFPGGEGWQDWKFILQYPQGLQVQSIVRDLSQGATCFLAEASYFTNGALGHRYAGAQFGVYPVLQGVLNGWIQIPTRSQVAAQPQVLAKGMAAYSTPGWNRSVNNAMAVDGRYGLPPLVPTTMPTADHAAFTTITTKQPTSYYDSVSPGFASTGNGWVVRSDGTHTQWYYTNPVMFEQRKTASVIPLTNVPGAQVTISSDEHTSVVIQENPNNLGVHVFNYRLDLTDALSQVADQADTVAFGQNHMAPRLDAAGDPVVNADGTITTVGNRILPDQTSRDVRDVTLAVVGTWNGGRPRVTFDDYPGMTRPYTRTETWDAATSTLTLALTMNGTSHFNVQIDGGGPHVLPRTGWTVAYADSQELSAENTPATNVLDGTMSTFWHTRWSDTDPDPACPHEIQLDMKAAHTVSGFTYLPRQDGYENGWVGAYEFSVSADGTNWGSPVAGGTFAADATLKTVRFPATTGRYVRFRALSEVNGQPWTSCADLTVIGL